MVCQQSGNSQAQRAVTARRALLAALVAGAAFVGVAVLGIRYCLLVITIPEASRVAATRSLILHVAAALEKYSVDWACYPPDTIPAGTPLCPLATDGAPSGLMAPATPPEALYHCLPNPNLSRRHPYLDLPKTLCADHDQDGLPEIVDGWGRPLLYNRPRVSSGAFDSGSDPMHRSRSYDLYSVGADGQTGTSPLPDPREGLAGFCKTAMDEAADGEGEDDVANWR